MAICFDRNILVLFFMASIEKDLKCTFVSQKKVWEIRPCFMQKTFLQLCIFQYIKFKSEKNLTQK